MRRASTAASALNPRDGCSCWPKRESTVSGLVLARAIDGSMDRWMSPCLQRESSGLGRSPDKAKLCTGWHQRCQPLNSPWGTLCGLLVGIVQFHSPLAQNCDVVGDGLIPAFCHPANLSSASVIFIKKARTEAPAITNSRRSKRGGRCLVRWLMCSGPPMVFLI